MLGLIMNKAIGELALIESIRSGWAAEPNLRLRRGAGVALGIGDDCAILRPPRGHEILVTTDFTLEDRHFRRDWHPAESVGHRTLARGLSDLAAMGASPLAAFLSLALPSEMLATPDGRRWVRRFFTGLRALAGQHSVPLAGGDTSESPCGLVLADIVLIGSAPTGKAIRRSGGRPGDLLYVTGALGGAAAELVAMKQLRQSKPPRMPSPNHGALHPQLLPQPRLAVGTTLLRRGLATAAIDLSDGLSTDLTHLCRESGLGARVDAAALPIHPLAMRGRSEADALGLALNGGEDYELLFAASPATRMPRSLAGVPITRIGILSRENKISLVDAAGHSRTLRPGGWQHFSSR